VASLRPHRHRTPDRAALLPRFQVGMTLQNVNAFVPILAGLPGDASKAKERQVLFQNAGVVEPGEMMALMGPSGSGVWYPGG